MLKSVTSSWSSWKKIPNRSWVFTRVEELVFPRRSGSEKPKWSTHASETKTRKQKHRTTEKKPTTRTRDVHAKTMVGRLFIFEAFFGEPAFSSVCMYVFVMEWPPRLFSLTLGALSLENQGKTRGNAYSKQLVLSSTSQTHSDCLAGWHFCITVPRARTTTDAVVGR